MEDGLGRLAAEDVVERRGADVDDMEPRGRVDLLPLTAAEIVHDRHPVAGLDAAIDHVGADETRAARVTEDLHVAALCGDDRGLPRSLWRDGAWGASSFGLRCAR